MASSAWDRLVSRIILSDDPDGCWELPMVGRYGYTVIGIYLGEGKVKNYRGHRISYELFYNKPIPDGMNVLHKCDNKKCVRPDHLYVGTQVDNYMDAVERGRVGMRNGKLRNSLSAEEVLSIRGKYAAGGNQYELAEEYNLRQSNISRIVNRKTWKHIA